jgi:zinc protease
VDLAEPEMKAERREALQDRLARLAQINIGYKIPPAAHADFPALTALGQILGAGESSRLYQRLVKTQELCANVGSGSAQRMGPGLFNITCTVRPGKKIEEAEAVITEEVMRLHTAPVSGDELQRVRTNVRRQAVGTRESALARAQALADNAVLYNDPNRINTNPDKVAAVTAADVQRVAAKYLQTTNRVVVHTLPAPAPTGGGR